MSETDVPRGARRRWLGIALAMSLALNLLVAGLVIGALLSPAGGGGPGAAMTGRETGFGPYVEALSPRDRRAIGRAMIGELGGVRAARAESRRSFEALVSTLRAVPFDPVATARIIEGQQNRLIQRQTLGRQLLTERIEAMSPAQRAEFADRLEAALARDPGEGRTGRLQRP